MADLLARCHWPELSAPYAEALREAVAFILRRYEVLGIIASGTIIRGNPGPSSDLDIYVIHARQQRQRVQKFFQGVPVEIFVNPVAVIESYFEAEIKRGRPCTAHMFSTGFVVLEQDQVVERLRQQAQAVLQRPPNPGEAKLTALRYGAADRYENACDIAATDPAGSSLILGLAIFDMLQYAFWEANRYLPREKDLLQAAAHLDPTLANLARDFYAATGIESRLRLAGEIAGRTIGTRGFFEWESPLEAVEGSGGGQKPG